MASKGYEIDEKRWFEEVEKLTSSAEIHVQVKWSFGHLLTTASLYRVCGRKISVVLHRGSVSDTNRLLLTVNIPYSGVDFVRKVDQNNHVLLCAYYAGEHFCLADSLDSLTFENSEARVQ